VQRVQLVPQHAQRRALAADLLAEKRSEKHHLDARIQQRAVPVGGLDGRGGLHRTGHVVLAEVARAVRTLWPAMMNHGTRT
jgi:hypothetical protein